MELQEIRGHHSIQVMSESRWIGLESVWLIERVREICARYVSPRLKARMAGGY